MFLRAYDQYVTDIAERAKQLIGKDVVSTEECTPVNLKFCVDSKWLESLKDLDFLDGVSAYGELTDTVLRSFLEKKAKESKEGFSLDVLYSLIDK